MSVGGPPRQPDRQARAMSLELFGQRISVVSDADEDRVHEVVSFVNRRLEAIRGETKRVQIDHIALLTALNLAEELFEERDRNERLRRKVRERSVRLLASIDELARGLDDRKRVEELIRLTGSENESETPNLLVKDSLPGS